MKKKFICTVCGYIHEGTEAPEVCPVCKASKAKFKEMDESDNAEFATVHTLGAARKEDANEEMIKDLNAHFNGECGEVGMYLAMSRQADREGYPEIAEALKHVLLQSVVHARINSALQKMQRWQVWMQLMIRFMKWQRTKHATVLDLWDYIRDILKNNILYN